MLNIDYFNGTGRYPFGKNNITIVIINTTDELISSAVGEYFYSKETFSLNNHTIFAVKENVTDEFFETCDMISVECERPFKAHIGFTINKNVSSAVVKSYLDLAIKYIKSSSEMYSTFITPIFKQFKEPINQSRYISEFKNMIEGSEINNPFTKDLIVTYFKNNLNVLKTAQNYGMVRSSILFKFKTIYKTTGINLLNFKDASALYIILNK